MTASEHRLSFVVTCKGRLEHLRQTLPDLMSQPGCETVVVDYDCPDRSGDWVAREHPQATVVRVADRPRFSLAEARNIGGRAARADWICFIDADIRADRGFVEDLLPRLAPRRYFVAQPRRGQLWGTIVVAAEDFRRIGGYDEAFEGWGGEDNEFENRLRLAGVRREGFPATLLSDLPHDDAMRTRFHAEQDKATSHLVSFAYVLLKADLVRLTNQDPPLEVRRRLMAQVRETVIRQRAEGRPIDISVSLPSRRQGEWEHGRSLRMTLTPHSTAKGATRP